MPNSDLLIQIISQTLSSAPQETAYFTRVNLQYPYIQLTKHFYTARHFNFNLFSGN